MAASVGDNMIYRLAFSMIRGNNLGLGNKILSYIGSEEAFFKKSESELQALLNVKSSVVNMSYRRSLLELAAKEYEFITNSGIKALFFNDEAYPCRLKNCEDGPSAIYVMGEANLSAPKILSVVGTRRATSYGVDMAKRIVADLASEYGKDIIIVSGLAYGIDVAGHLAALSSGIPTVAVTGHPLNTIYPADHRNIAIDIIRNGGALVSEYPSSSVVHKGNFLQRNRIVAGIADATLIVESDEKGGAMVTASIAGAYDRDVFAVPGRTVDKYSRGTNRLIAENRAVLVRDAGDIIDAMRWGRKPKEGEQKVMTLDLSAEQLNALIYIREHPQDSVNEISRGLGISYSALTGVLFELEMSDLIVSIPGNRYALTSLASEY